MNGDAYLQSILQKTPHKQEALSWLKQGDSKERTIGDGEQDAAASLRLVQDLYRHGALEVIAVDIDVDTHLETTSTLIVRLPAEAAARQAVFRDEAEAGRAGGFEASADEGQSYVMLHW